MCWALGTRRAQVLLTTLVVYASFAVSAWYAWQLVTAMCTGVLAVAAWIPWYELPTLDGSDIVRLERDNVQKLSIYASMIAVAHGATVLVAFADPAEAIAGFFACAVFYGGVYTVLTLVSAGIADSLREAAKLRASAPLAMAPPPAPPPAPLAAPLVPSTGGTPP